ncbi:hypothetical protein Tco_0827087 [Tanacetum coccineum]
MLMKSFDTLADHLQEVMVESLPTMVDKHIKEQVEKQVPAQVKVQVLVYVAKGLILERQQHKEKRDKMIAKAIYKSVGTYRLKFPHRFKKCLRQLVKTPFHAPKDQVQSHDNDHPDGAEKRYRRIVPNADERKSSSEIVLEGLKSYNNDVRYGYIQRDLTEDKVEYLKLFEEEIEVSQPNEKMGDVCEWKTTWTMKGTPRIIDP